jgi:hypothetical protein
MQHQVVQEPATVIAQALAEVDDGFSLRLQRKPEAIVAEARLCADALVAAVRRNGWVQKFGGRDHLFFEAWAFLAAMYRVTPRTRDTRIVQIGDVIGYECTAEAFHVPSGIVIGSADAMCLNDEDNWSNRPTYEWDARSRRKVQTGERPVPLFQLRSMAQTRAQAKALKGPFSWVVAMAGFAPVAAEEMSGSEAIASVQETPAPRQAAPVPPAPPVQSASRETAPEVTPSAPPEPNGKRLITGKQASRIWALGFSQGVDKKLIPQIVQGFGFARIEDVTADKYDEVCAAVENVGAGAAQ